MGGSLQILKKKNCYKNTKNPTVDGSEAEVYGVSVKKVIYRMFNEDINYCLGVVVAAGVVGVGVVAAGVLVTDLLATGEFFLTLPAVCLRE
ncbi:MAG: hypothetical protein ACHBN1_26955 [Heteroscytonema crispum UTEX LB 1556]